MIHHLWSALAHRTCSLSHCVYMTEFEYGYKDSAHASNPHEGHVSVFVGFRLIAKAWWSLYWCQSLLHGLCIGKAVRHIMCSGR